MPFPVAIATSLIVALVISSAFLLLQGQTFPDFALMGAFCLTAVLSAVAARAGSNKARPASASRAAAVDDDDEGDREQGSVKWFNVSKGFGFITMDDGQEIFVHFRSIRGEGRRSLRDGQRVSFRVADSDKGPQAEDVEPL